MWLVGVASGSGWNQWVWLAVGGCGWNLWEWLVGVVVRRYIDFVILLVPTLLVSVRFAAASLVFVHLKKFFSFLFRYFFVIKFYVINNISQSINIQATTGVPWQPYEGLCFIHEEAHTN